MRTEEERYWLERDFVLELLKQLPSHVFWKNKESVYLGCNDTFARSLGLASPDEIVGKTDYDLPTTREESNGFRTDDQHVMESRECKLNIEERQSFPDGREVYLLTSKVPLLNKDDEVIGILGIYSEITDRKLAEQELKAAKEQAETANQIKTEFIQNMQHDVRTPTSGVVSGMEILLQGLHDLLDKYKDPALKDLCQLALMISKSSQQIHDFLNEAIDFENIDYLTKPIQAKKIDTVKVAQSIIDIEYLAAKTKNTKLTLYFEPEVPRVIKGDEYRLKRILLNLVSNAVKFTSEGQVELRVRVHHTLDDSILLTFIVSDTGVGIPKDKLNTIFEKYTRLNPSSRGMYGGSGLGLFRVKQFVDALDGEVDVESELGKGSNFYVTIPFEKPLVDEIITTRFQFGGDRFQSSDQRQENYEALPKPTIFPKLQNYQVLLIEDDMLAHTAAKSRLVATGCSVDAAETVSEALLMLDKKTFDLVVSDIGLPDGSGIDIIRRVKSSQTALNYKTPFVALTAHSDPAKQLALLRSGFLLVLKKPLTDLLINDIFKKCRSLSMKKNGTLPVVDWEQAASQHQDAGKLSEDIVSLFAEILPAEKTQLISAYRSQDMKRVRDLLHKMEGACAYCPAPRLQRAVKSLNLAVKDDILDSEMDILFESLLREIDLVVEVA